MSDTITKWHEMEEEKKLSKNAEQFNQEIQDQYEIYAARYIFLLLCNQMSTATAMMATLQEFASFHLHKLANLLDGREDDE